MNVINYALAKREWDNAHSHMIEFGSSGRNLILGSSNFEDGNGNFLQYTGVPNIWMDSGKVYAETLGLNNDRLRIGLRDNKGNRNGLDYEEGQEYTVSLIYETTNPTINSAHFGGKFYEAGNNARELGTLSNFSGNTEEIETGLYKSYGTFTINGRENPDNEVISIYFYPNRSGDTGKTLLTIHNIKIEKGRKPSPYTPAPEDLGIHPVVARMSEVEYESASNQEDLEILRSAIVSMGGSI